MQNGEELAGLPLIGVPMAAWVGKGEAADEIVKWREAYLAGMLITRYADVLIMHGLDGWSLLPNTVLRQNIYTDPRKPVQLTRVSRYSELQMKNRLSSSTRTSLTYYTVASDIESSKMNAYLIVSKPKVQRSTAGVADAS